MAEARLLTVQVLSEPGAEGRDRSDSYILTAVKTAFRNLRDGSSVCVVIRDEDGDLIGSDVTGTPSAATLSEYKELLGG